MGVHAQLLRDFMRDFVRQQQDTAEHDAWLATLEDGQDAEPDECHV